MSCHVALKLIGLYIATEECLHDFLIGINKIFKDCMKYVHSLQD